MVTFDLTPTHFFEWQAVVLKHKWGLFHGLLGTLGCLIFILGVFTLLQPSTGSTAGQLSVQSLPPEKIQVYVSGAVQQPGVYTLELGQRVSDVLTLAGGLTDGVDLQAVSSQLNLATKVTDEEHIHVPFLIETVANSPLPNTPTGTHAVEQAVNGSGKVSVNTATVEELMSLPQIGEKRATDIVAGRPYSSIDELLTKEIVTEKMFAIIRDLITTE